VLRDGTLDCYCPVTDLCAVPSGTTAHAAESYRVNRVIDGDTVVLRVLNTPSDVTIRLVGIDAPETSKAKREPGQTYSQAATKHLAGLVLNKTVTVKEYGRDRYGRILGVVFLNGTDINLEMVKAGLAEVYRGVPAPGFKNEPYLNAEKDARQAGKGMWSLGEKYVSPRDWRRMQKE
jgi:endonuclease YncB( thermonuclease family)